MTLGHELRAIDAMNRSKLYTPGREPRAVNAMNNSGLWMT